MSNSSAEQIYSITLDDTLSTSMMSDTITITGSNSWSSGFGAIPGISTGNWSIGAQGTTASTVFNGGSASTFTVGAGSDTFTWNQQEEWVNAFPQWARIEDMCKQYPGLAIAFEKFKTTYRLVKDDYDNPKDKK